MARFEREAQLLASLNHPHIAALHGLEESGSTRALVMELVEGPTLADRIATGPIPLEEALGIANHRGDQLAGGVEEMSLSMGSPTTKRRYMAREKTRERIVKA